LTEDIPFHGALFLAFLPVGAGIAILWRAICVAEPPEASKSARTAAEIVALLVSMGVAMCVCVAAGQQTYSRELHRFPSTASVSYVLLAVALMLPTLWIVLRANRVRNAFLCRVVGLIAFASVGVAVAVGWACAAPTMGGPVHGGWRGRGFLQSSDMAVVPAVFLQLLMSGAAGRVSRGIASERWPHAWEDEESLRKQRRMCASCGYPVLANAVRCPECGQAWS
jgi:hypothetical protein